MRYCQFNLGGRRSRKLLMEVLPRLQSATASTLMTMRAPPFAAAAGGRAHPVHCRAKIIPAGRQLVKALKATRCADVLGFGAHRC
jgi:hypothetical protein